MNKNLGIIHALNYYFFQHNDRTEKELSREKNKVNLPNNTSIKSHLRDAIMIIPT